METALFRPGDRPWLHLGLFGLTAVTTLIGYMVMFGGWGMVRFQGWTPLLLMPAAGQILEAAKFSAGVLLILGTHEMGHYLAARWHRVDTSLPYFIPMPPVISIGTLGAVIRIRGPIPHLNALVDIGASGPLAGLLVAIPVLVLGLLDAPVVTAPVVDAGFPGRFSLLGLLGELVAYLWGDAAGSGLPETATRVQTLFAEGLLLKGLSWAVVGPLQPGQDLVVGPLWLAGWFGLLVTTLNLFPIGQLDGGHVAHALFGKGAVWVGRATALGLAVLTLFWSVGWLVWLLVTVKFIGFGHPPVTSPELPLSPSRKVIAVLCLIAFILCVTAVPISTQLVP